MEEKIAVIIGAGPAGLTAAYEILKKTEIKPIIFEKTNGIGGISRNIIFNGNRLNIGPHRFFSKSEEIIHWWFSILPLQGHPAKDDILLNRTLPYSKGPGAPDPEKDDNVMLIRKRISRIFYNGKFFPYPVVLNYTTIKNLGFIQCIKIGISYIWSRIFQIHPEKSLEDFLINRFGKELYEIFFKYYTMKVWGVSPKEIPPDWGIQRIKGLSIINIILHILKKMLRDTSDISQKDIQTSLIERFFYPKLGAGQIWEKVAEKIREGGGEIYLNNECIGIHFENNKILEIVVKDRKTNKIKRIKGDFFFSAIPIKDLIIGMEPSVPENVKVVAEGLSYRDLIVIGLLLKQMKIRKNEEEYINPVNNLIPDNWIYVQDRTVKVGRIQIFNNWSPYIVKNWETTVLLGLEYFCNEGDALWNKKDEELFHLAIDELCKIGLAEKEDVLDYVIIRVPKAYPSYLGSYKEFKVIRDFLDRFENLFLIGRNGMHRYNNMDHSMLTAMTAVENIIKGIKTKENIWAVNTEEEYHEEKN